MSSISMRISRAKKYINYLFLLNIVLLLTACAGQSKISKANIDNKASADQASKEKLGIQKVEGKLVKSPSTQDSAFKREPLNNYPTQILVLM
jgi:phosphate transport system substrate-binding protein